MTAADRITPEALETLYSIADLFAHQFTIGMLAYKPTGKDAMEFITIYDRQNPFTKWYFSERDAKLRAELFDACCVVIDSKLASYGIV